MNIFLKVEKLMSQIKREVLKDETLRKLLYYGTPDALEQTVVPAKEDVENFVYISNYIDRKQYDNQHAFIAIYTTGIAINDNISDVEFQIGVYAWENTTMLDNDRMRTLQLLHRISQILQDKNMNFTGHLNCFGANIEGYDHGNVLGYVSTWGVVDDDGFNELSN